MSITINGTAGRRHDDGRPTGLGSGTFVSGLSPLFIFRSFEALTVNPAAVTGFDHVIFNATEGPDTITSNADTITLADNLDPYS